ncbi:MAG: hypothetical protein WCA39_18460 [Nitrososphaeraceae archaeon]|jgi:hypothetical protein
MGKWKKDAKEFAVGVNYVEDRGYSSSIPKPIMDKLGNPDSLKFIIRDDKTIQLVPGKSVSYSGKVKHNG